MHVICNIETQTKRNSGKGEKEREMEVGGRPVIIMGEKERMIE